MWRELRDRGPVAFIGLGLAVVGMAGAMAVLGGWRFPIEASRASRLTLLGLSALFLAHAGVRMVRDARAGRPQPRAELDKSLALIMLSVLCGLISLALGPR